MIYNIFIVRRNGYNDVIRVRAKSIKNAREIINKRKGRTSFTIHSIERAE